MSAHSTGTSRCLIRLPVKSGSEPRPRERPSDFFLAKVRRLSRRRICCLGLSRRRRSERYAHSFPNRSSISPGTHRPVARHCSNACVATCDWLHELGTKASEFVVRYRTGLFQPKKLGDLVRYAETNNAAQFVSLLLRLLDIPLGHPSCLCD